MVLWAYNYGCTYCLYCCLPSKYVKVDIFGNWSELVSLSPNENLSSLNVYKNSSIFQMYWLEFFFTWPFSSRCDYIILYSYYKIEREFVVNTYTILQRKWWFLFIYISTSSQLHCILLGRVFLFMKEIMKKIGPCGNLSLIFFF